MVAHGILVSALGPHFGLGLGLGLGQGLTKREYFFWYVVFMIMYVLITQKLHIIKYNVQLFRLFLTHSIK